MSAYIKSAIAFFTALGTWGATSMVDGELNAVEAFGLSGVIVSALAVWAIPNTPPED